MSEDGPALAGRHPRARADRIATPLHPRWALQCALAGSFVIAACHAGSDRTPGDAGREADARDTGSRIAPPDAIVDVAPTYAPTFSALYSEVFLPSCGLTFCHLSDTYFALSDQEAAYRSLVNAPAEGGECRGTGLMRVEPNHPERSLLYLKVTDPPCGKRMPALLGTDARLDPRQVEQIRQWIDLGAPDD